MALLENNTAAPFCGVAPATLKQSRVTGVLCGVPAPAYIKLGRKVVYKEQTIANWLSQFDEQTNTAQGEA